MRAIGLLAIGSSVALAAPPARATDTVITCAGTSHDVAAINAAIATVAQSAQAASRSHPALASSAAARSCC